MVCCGNKFAEAVKNILVTEFLFASFGTCVAFWILYHEYEEDLSNSSSISQAAASGSLYDFLLAISLINAVFLSTFTLIFAWIEWPGEFQISSSWFINLVFRVIGITGLILLGMFTTFDNSSGCTGIPPTDQNATTLPCTVSFKVARTHQAGALLYMVHYLVGFFSQITAFPRKLCTKRTSFGEPSRPITLCSVHFWNMAIGLSALVSVILFLILGENGLNVIAVLFEGIAVFLISILYAIHMCYVLKSPAAGMPEYERLLKDGAVHFGKLEDGRPLMWGAEGVDSSKFCCCTVVDYYD